jgi:hypothetical protein
MDVRPAILVFLFLVPSALAINIELEIGRQIDGYMPWLNTTQDSPQKYSIAWQNTGSVYCKSRPRLDVSNANGTVYTAWGSEATMMPGDTVTWNLHSYLGSGRYEYNIIFYHCNDVYRYGSYQLAVANATPHEDVIEIIGSSADDTGVELVVRSAKDMDNIALIPADYPLGWIFESGETDIIKAGETRTVRLSYDPIKWEGQLITFVAASEDGSYVLRKPVILRRAEFPYERIIFILAAAVALVIYLYYKKIIFEIWKR